MSWLRTVRPRLWLIGVLVAVGSALIVLQETAAANASPTNASELGNALCGGATVTLAAPISDASAQVETGANCVATLDLNGQAVTVGNVLIGAGGTLTIEDRSGSPATLTATSPVAGGEPGIRTTDATLIVRSGTVIATGRTGGAGIGGGQDENGGTVSIAGGTVIATGAAGGAGIGGGQRLAGGQDGNGGIVTISGGVVEATGAGGSAGIGGGQNGNGGPVSITGGTVTATGVSGGAGIGGGQDGDGGAVTISGGTVMATGGGHGAGIGGGFGGAGGMVTIESGTVTATGGVDSAGIGGGDGGAGGSVTISGGTVTAAGGFSGAGIGGGDGRAGGSVTISGGTVTATGGDNGAGIGGGFGGAGGTVTISGGTVTATGGDDGAGIGSGFLGAGGTVTISGGTVTATGGDDGAGIGSGFLGSGGTVEISGGTVAATGGSFGAGIGGGRLSAFGSVTILGGTVTATAGIGAGSDAEPIGRGSSGTAGPVAVDPSAIDSRVGLVRSISFPAPLVSSNSVASLQLVCGDEPARVGATVTCKVTGGEPGVDILWRAAYNPPFAGEGVTLDASGSGEFSFTVPAAALGEELTVELVEWLAPVSLGVVGGPVPGSVPAGDGPVPVWSILLVALVGVGLLRFGMRTEV